jgi:hypothetical protein
MMKKSAALYLCFLALLLCCDSAVARPEPKYVLKGITIINFFAGAGESEQCKIDYNGLVTALQFVANQSIQLKIVAASDQMRRGKELDEIADQIWNKAKTSGKVEDMMATMKDAKYQAARNAAYDYNLMPHLSIVVQPMDLEGGGCVGSVSATLSAYLDSKTNNMEIVPTHARVSPTVEIWSGSYLFIGTKQTFANQATRIAEDLMKQLVNDWTASQDLE